MKKLIHNLQSNYPNSLFLYLIFASMFLTFSNMSAQKKDRMVRLSEIEIYPEYLSEYKAILKEESSVSVKLEPGVLAIFPMYQKNDSTQVRILEIYNDNDAYQSHLKTPHFQKYKTTTIKMVKSLKLVDMNIIDSESMKMLFRKMIE
ncbi:antibiotic biosynthesis monooxygenase [Flavobacterium sp. KACC 22758]|uniref:putative quinol monooxygenase n=1 Tax=Flavobacterium sp. KACC 22758 TaxID=3025667 RepID=UPI002365A165|nr:antibiotic biosynthesis monooxygenase family protein [Flavobacterium sp. KACC 22758]WDF61899.1 antibiotic biosynthesis monooxygenase [Flavobacterium sp. KACC 22758]